MDAFFDFLRPFAWFILLLAVVFATLLEQGTGDFARYDLPRSVAWALGLAFVGSMLLGIGLLRD